MPNFISEDQIEQALLQKLQHLHGFDVLNCHTEDPADLNDDSGRVSKSDVILLGRVKEAAIRLNPGIPEMVISHALESLMDKRRAMSLIAANREVYSLLRDGIPVEFDNAKDIVYHFPRRGYLGKGMVVSLDKFTTVKMYDEVQRLWKQELKDLRLYPA